MGYYGRFLLSTRFMDMDNLDLDHIHQLIIIGMEEPEPINGLLALYFGVVLLARSVY
jgi:hypothetical protein